MKLLFLTTLALAATVTISYAKSVDRPFKFDDVNDELKALARKVKELEETEIQLKRELTEEDVRINRRIDTLEHKHENLSRLFNEDKLARTTSTPVAVPIRPAAASRSVFAVPAASAAASTPISNVLLQAGDDHRCIEGGPGRAFHAICAGKPHQIWSYTNGNLINQKTGLCLTLNSLSESEVSNQECSDNNERQRWARIGKQWRAANGECLSSGVWQAFVAECQEGKEVQQFTLKSPSEFPVLTEETTESSVPEGVMSRRLKTQSPDECLFGVSKERSWALACNGSPVEQWYILPDQTIRNKWNNLCLDGSNEDRVTAEVCNSHQSQKWTAFGDWGFKNSRSDKCLTAGFLFAFTKACDATEKRQQFRP